MTTHFDVKNLQVKAGETCSQIWNTLTALREEAITKLTESQEEHLKAELRQVIANIDTARENISCTGVLLLRQGTSPLISIN